jgi:NitT/TauT family transport system ATP-binding protein
VFSAGRIVVTALANLDLVVEQGRFVSILGPSGCGKSTLLRIVGGLIPPSSGTVTVNGKSPMEAQRHKEIGFVFQSAGLLPWRTVLQNVELPLEVNRAGNRRRREDSGALLELVGLSAFRDSYPHQLSGGMQQRVAIARALVFAPDMMLMDEPFGALDEITRDAMRYELLRIWEHATKTVLFVTHSITEAIILSDTVVVMATHPGRIREIVPIDLPRPRDEAMERSPRFQEYAGDLKSLLR